MINELKLDLACGQIKKEGFFGIDIVKTEAADAVVDLQKYPWPIESDSAEEVHCAHYIEHIKHDNVHIDLQEVLEKSNTFEEFKENILKPEFARPTDGFIKFMNELNRIVKKGGKVSLHAPYYASMRAFGDPTHTRYIADFSAYYFNKEWREKVGLGHMDIDCDFDVKFSYLITNDMTLKSEEVRNKAFKEDWNVIDDIYIDLTKR